MFRVIMMWFDVREKANTVIIKPAHTLLRITAFKYNVFILFINKYGDEKNKSFKLTMARTNNLNIYVKSRLLICKQVNLPDEIIFIPLPNAFE